MNLYALIKCVITTLNLLCQDERQHYGIDWDGPTPHNINGGNNGEDYNAVVIPEIECPLDVFHVDELDDEISPLEDSTNYGIDLYEKTLDFLSLKLNILL